jgi:hypothetical protein
VAKYFHLGKRWEASVGADYVRNYEEETINSTSVVDNGSSSDSTVSYSSRITEGSGGGLQLGLNYMIAPGILLGTESTMYLISSDQKENTTVKIYSTFISFPQFDNSSLSSDNLHTEEKSFRISIPVAIFLRVKF